MCIASGKERVEALDSYRKLYTLYTELFNKNNLNPQFIQSLHNFYTQKSTAKTSLITDTSTQLSTVSTEPITTTTIKYKEGL
jgi:hypothetical protein